MITEDAAHSAVDDAVRESLLDEMELWESVV
jgi:hypothetical protein